MANQEHIDIFKQEADVWNEWRYENPHIYPDLSGLDFSNEEFIQEFDWEDFEIKDLRNVDLSEVDLSWRDFSGMDFSGIVLSGATLSGTNLMDAILSDADLSQANLSQAALTIADLRWSDLTRANLHKARLSEANLSEADMREAQLSEADLTGTVLTGADLSGADLSRACIARTVFAALDLRFVKGLETVIHDGPSTIGIDTLERSHGEIPEIFLRRAGASEQTIAYAHSLASRTERYSPCFISCSGDDQLFAEQLHADLQARGVRCWFALEDVKDQFRHRINASMRLQDRLIVVLSKSSIQSSWVEYEVTMALDKEKRLDKQILLPIELDPVLRRANQSWATSLRRQHSTRDFARWKETDAYQQALNQLLQELRLIPS